MLGTGRGAGVTEWLHAYAEGPALVLVALITQLGDVWFLFLLGGLLYIAGSVLPRWRIDRRRGLFVLALVVTYVALIGGLKATFHLPRPPGAGEPPTIQWLPPFLTVVVDNISTAEGPGFPSGHALGSTMVWGGVALVLDSEPDRVRFGVAGGAVTLIAVSRLALGVHYAVDVVVGIAFGVVALGVLYWLSERGTDPGRVLGAAVAFGLFDVLMGLTFESVAAIGSAVGGWLMWRGVADSIPVHATTYREVSVGFVVFAVSGGLFGVLYALEPGYPITFFGAALTTAGVVAAPLVGERLA